MEIQSITANSLPVQTFPYGNIPFNADAGMNVSDVFPFPVTEIPRNPETLPLYYEYLWLGQMADGTQIPNGNYT